ncbi:ras-related protein Rab-32 isoform X1 [Tribolium castaneum]|uniref:ras-related protein Rab-32 isoform X1 n=1 Tax=Tribolium castaneum TaxID=7070 RepID=UPI0000D560ED|nr:PREDICTED: ras-related protein Rab-32 isoform X1 [Tribolium castaneum]|eukprot:XP_974043.1 PREDICTED: ras-related protein Rab-32 isoform X1 [Tribolium castaneum]
MKNDVPSEHKTIVEVTQEKRTKKVVIPPKSSNFLKPKKASLLIKKIKLKSKSPSRSPKEGPVSLSLPSTSTSPLGRQTPEGDDSLMFAKSVSESNLSESWKSAETLAKSADNSGVKAESSQNRVCVEVPERTKSLETLKDMPAYGDLIFDPAATVSYANKTTERKDHLYKILVIGDLGAGKTSIIKRYVHRFFTQHYRATIGVDFALKVLNWDDNTLIRLQLWDIAGQERYGNMTRVYYKEAVGAFIVFDVTRTNTFESVAKWKSDLDSKVQLSDGSPIPCVLLANKCDQQKEGLVNHPNKMDEYCKENGFTTWFETSAKDNINIDEAANALVAKILENDTLLNVDSLKDEDKFSISKEPSAQRNGKMCSC